MAGLGRGGGVPGARHGGLGLGAGAREWGAAGARGACRGPRAGVKAARRGVVRSQGAVWGHTAGLPVMASGVPHTVVQRLQPGNTPDSRFLMDVTKALMYTSASPHSSAHEAGGGVEALIVSVLA